MRASMPGGETKALLIVLCGLPGSGKTTLARRLAAELPAVRLCPDEWLAKLGVDLYDEGARERLEGQFEAPYPGERALFDAPRSP
ncbi:AAA family ATPase [Nonomuraea sp. NPDC059007]|uniref:AAA family ATPase n=1 Tax=Nonomuraea sp. NPDC059007 TaxID=3346692 RepID=UPI003692323E